MRTFSDIRNLRLPTLSRTGAIVGSLLVVAAMVAGFAGLQLYRKLTSTTVVAYFPEANALYPGDAVNIMGIRVGSIDSIEPVQSDRCMQETSTADSAGRPSCMKVTLHYQKKYKVPHDASAIILNPTLVASRNIQLEPPYRGGPTLADGDVIPEERTQVPVEWDTLRNDVTNIVTKLGPTPEQPKGPFGEAIEAFADGLAGKGEQINTTFAKLSEALTALNKGRGDFFSVVRSLALFVNALHTHDQQFVALNRDLAGFTDLLARTDGELAQAADQFYATTTILKAFLDQNAALLTKGIKNTAEITNATGQPVPMEGLETFLHISPTTLASLDEIYHPAQGAISSLPVLSNFANPMEFICSAIQAGSRLGFQDSAELCAEYLGPILDAIKFNYLPFGLNTFNTAYSLPKHIAYTEERLRPPRGYKDTTVPGIWVPDTPLSHRNVQPGWIVAPGMQGVRVGHNTARLLTPESLAELMGGPDIAPIESQYETPPGPPNIYDEIPAGPWPNVGLPINPAPIPPPPPAANVIPGPVPQLPPREAGQ